MAMVGGREKQPNGERPCFSERFDSNVGSMDGPKRLARDRIFEPVGQDGGAVEG
jgi:hypothetical protein